MNLSCGWYMNNCGCAEKTFTDPTFIEHVYQQSTAALVQLNVDEVKLDGCSQFTNTSLWQSLLTNEAKPTIGKFPIENCHNNYGNPTFYPLDLDTCPFTMFRTSSDIRPVWERLIHNLQTTIPFLSSAQARRTSLSRPGCHAFPDMLEVGHLGPDAVQ
eukprot:gene56906-biopygen102990